MRIPIPKQILCKIEEITGLSKGKDGFSYEHLRECLKSFIDSKLIHLNGKLYDRFYSYHGLDIRTLRRAWSQKEGSHEDLRNLLCYFAFKTNWDETLKKYGLYENELIKQMEIRRKTDNKIDIQENCSYNQSDISIFIETLSGSVNKLIRTRDKGGHWGDVRCTTLAIWALNTFFKYTNLEESSVNDLKEKQNLAFKWLCSKSRKESPGISWDSEAWDTSLSIIALTFDESYMSKVEESSLWLHDIRDKTFIRGRRSGVWYDEVWETTLSTIALIKSEEIRQVPIQPLLWVEDVLKWLIAIPSKPSGEFICPHYSGFLLWLYGEIAHSQETKSILTSLIFDEFEIKVNSAKKWLLSVCSEKSDELWSLYTFSNSYIIIGLISLREKLPLSLLHQIVIWYNNKSRKSLGVFEDIEDTSLAILALSFLIEEFNIDKSKLNSKIVWSE